MIAKTFLIAAISTAVLSGCATQSAPTDKADGSVESLEAAAVKLSVNQTGRGQKAEYTFCVEGKCQNRSEKFLAVPAQQQVQKKELPAIAPKLSYMVHFRWGWSRLDDDGINEVEKVVSALGRKKARKIEIAGRTDPTGSLKFNKILALKRAETVKAALVQAGIPASIIETKSEVPCCDGDLKAPASVMRQLRRTDIELTITPL